MAKEIDDLLEEEKQRARAIQELQDAHRAQMLAVMSLLVEARGELGPFCTTIVGARGGREDPNATVIICNTPVAHPGDSGNGNVGLLRYGAVTPDGYIAIVLDDTDVPEYIHHVLTEFSTDGQLPPVPLYPTGDSVLQDNGLLADGSAIDVCYRTTDHGGRQGSYTMRFGPGLFGSRSRLIPMDEADFAHTLRTSIAAAVAPEGRVLRMDDPAIAATGGRVGEVLDEALLK